MDAPLRIELLGWLRIKHGERVISQFRTQKTSALLAYLALNPERHHARESLVDLLWPEADLENGLARLSKELWSLRSELKPESGSIGDRAFITRRLTICLDSAAFTTDVAEFCSLLDRSSSIADPRKRRDILKKAIELYRGELLPSLYEDFVLTQREHLATRYQDALRQLTALCEEAGDVQDAIVYAQLAITADPLWEQSYLSLARLFSKTGQYTRAMRQYEELERVLAEELGARPSAEAAALFGRLKETAGAMAGRILEEVQIHQIEGAATDEAAGGPTLEPMPLHPAPFPLQLTHFFGREDEIARVSHHFAMGGVRLVTLLGPSGAGKTRLATEIVTRMSCFRNNPRPLFDIFAFAPLSDVSDAGQIPAAIAHALNLTDTGDSHGIDHIARALASRRTLLVLDNLEHIAKEAAPIVHTLLEVIPGLSILTTSRQRLCLPGEQYIPVPQLPVPNGGEDHDDLLLLPSVQLFADRARTSRPGFQISDNIADVSTLCRKLEGIPLAIELCAAWSESMTPADLIGHLDQRFKLLVNHHEGVPPRHRSLQAAIDYSYRQLTPELQRAFARLSLFRGGWTAEAACAVVSDRPEDAPLSTHRHLSELLERSMIQSEEIKGEMRFRMFETLREFGQEQMEQHEPRDAGRRHAGYYLALAQKAHQGLFSSRPAPHLAQLDAEHENLRAALAWCLDDTGVETGLAIAVALTNYWTIRGHLAEGKSWFDKFLALGQGDIPLPLLLDSLRSSGRLAWRLGDAANYRSLSERGLEIAKSQNDSLNIARALHCLGGAAMSLGNYDFARKCTEESFEIYQSLGQKSEAGEVLNNLGIIISINGDDREAKKIHQQALSMRKEAEYQFGVVQSFLNLSNIAIKQEDYGDARELLIQAITLSQELGTREETAYCLEGFAAISSRRAQPERAAILISAAEKVRKDTVATSQTGQGQTLEEIIAYACGESD